MIKVSFNRKGKTLMFTADGHAGSAEIGKDLVCAAASILAYDIAQCVSDAYKEGKLAKKPTIDIKENDGYTKVVCTPKPENDSEICTQFNTIVTGYRLLAHNHGKYIELKLFGEVYRP